MKALGNREGWLVVFPRIVLGEFTYSYVILFHALPYLLLCGGSNFL